MSFLRLTKEARTYILKSERPEYWENRIKTLQKEISDIESRPIEQQDTEKLQEKQEELESVKEVQGKALIKLAKYGPTKWQIVSASQMLIDKIMDRLDKPIIKIRGKGKDELTSRQVSYTRSMAREICKEWLKGWSNLHDPDKPLPEGWNEMSSEEREKYAIPFDATLIPELPYEITSELSNQISGNIDEDEIANLS